MFNSIIRFIAISCKNDYFLIEFDTGISMNGLFSGKEIYTLVCEI